MIFNEQPTNDYQDHGKLDTYLLWIKGSSTWMSNDKMEIPQKSHLINSLENDHHRSSMVIIGP